MKNGKSAKHHYSKHGRRIIQTYVSCYLKTVQISTKKRRNSAKPLFIAMQKGYFDVCTVYMCTENDVNHKCQQKSSKSCTTTVHFNTEQ